MNDSRGVHLDRLEAIELAGLLDEVGDVLEAAGELVLALQVEETIEMLEDRLWPE